MAMNAVEDDLTKDVQQVDVTHVTASIPQMLVGLGAVVGVVLWLNSQFEASRERDQTQQAITATNTAAIHAIQLSMQLMQASVEESKDSILQMEHDWRNGLLELGNILNHNIEQLDDKSIKRHDKAVELFTQKFGELKSTIEENCDGNN